MTATITIRPEGIDDHAAIREVVTAAFGSAAEADLVDRIRASPEYVPSGSLVAVADSGADGGADGQGEVVVGHVMISGATLELSQGGVRPIVMLSPLAVRPDRQRDGIGGSLVRAAVAAADALDEPFVVLEGAPAYYSRFGFAPAAAHGITLPLPHWAPPEAAQLHRLRHDDASLTGRVVYPAAFDGLG
jgi:putative acetyltransferase